MSDGPPYRCDCARADHQKKGTAASWATTETPIIQARLASYRTPSSQLPRNQAIPQAVSKIPYPDPVVHPSENQRGERVHQHGARVNQRQCVGRYERQALDVHCDKREVDESGRDECDPGDVHDERAVQPERFVANRFGLELFRVGEAGMGDEQQCDCRDGGNGEDGECYPIALPSRSTVISPHARIQPPWGTNASRGSPPRRRRTRQL